MVNPAAKKDSIPPANLMVYTSWADVPAKDDVDTWMLPAGVKTPIGYDHKESEPCDLLKDDLGTDNKGMNFENIFCRDLPDGEYIINVQGFSIEGPTEVTIQIVLNTNGINTEFNEKVILKGPKDEKTVIRFKLKDGQLVPGSVHHTFVSLFDM